MPREPLSRRQASTDRLLAAVIYVVSGLFVGVAVGIATGSGWLWTGIGLVVGVAVAAFMDRRGRRPTG
ncbi:hypothetical protein [Nakamurella endophytica]|uniref:Uncharacterized protein n=1 Tax=Nakamurella endophytica TaxID=1748367 RepID=A0A917SM97_9ACTN|nr:hypothetical protein [Nakamurella endophytica]GGL89637.1 hypothetical protein GCM10011594_06600 [Nakamurella endophytica]